MGWMKERESVGRDCGWTQGGRWRGIGKGCGVVCRVAGGGGGKGQGVWREKSGGRKQEEGEVATASSPSYK